MKNTCKAISNTIVFQQIIIKNRCKNLTSYQEYGQICINIRNATLNFGWYRINIILCYYAY